MTRTIHSSRIIARSGRTRMAAKYWVNFTTHKLHEGRFPGARARQSGTRGRGTTGGSFGPTVVFGHPPSPRGLALQSGGTGLKWHVPPPHIQYTPILTLRRAASPPIREPPHAAPQQQQQTPEVLHPARSPRRCGGGWARGTGGTGGIGGRRGRPNPRLGQQRRSSGRRLAAEEERPHPQPIQEAPRQALRPRGASRSAMPDVPTPSHHLRRFGIHGHADEPLVRGLVDDPVPPTALGAAVWKGGQAVHDVRGGLARTVRAVDWRRVLHAADIRNSSLHHLARTGHPL